MNNVGGTMAKLVALAGGAVAGALLARWFDNIMEMQSAQRSDYDKARYEQGLAPVAPPPTLSPEPKVIRLPLDEWQEE